MTLRGATPALPVRDVARSVAFFRDRLGFTSPHVTEDFAVVERDGVQVHLWRTKDESWRDRPDLAERPVANGAESFLAGTGGCRIEVTDVESLFAELAPAGVLHPAARGRIATTDFGTREFPCLDPDGNLVTFFRWER